MNTTLNLQNKAINTIRFLSADAVEKANSGHPGLPMGAAAMAYCLWTRHLVFNPQNPQWINRDRFILSGGHGSMLLYSLLYLTGYNVTLQDIKQFRQLNSITPGHPEYGLTPGVEVTTGPLGQGFANGVGMAIAGKHLAAEFNRIGFDLVNNSIYAIVTDGDLMEGVSSEAASLAGHLRLGNLIYLYDDNHVSIDGNTAIAFTEDRMERFNAYHWHTQVVEDGNDVEAIDLAIQAAKLDPRPSIIAVKTQIGFGLPNKQGTSKAHGEPAGKSELESAKKNLGWPVEPDFFVPEDVLDHFHKVGSQGVKHEEDWNNLYTKYREEFPAEAGEFERRLNKDLPDGWDKDLFSFPADPKGKATRNISGTVINKLAKYLPELIGGSADLAPSNKTWIDGQDAYQSATPGGRNFHFGVREHAMSSIVNGMAIYGGIRPYGGTFLTFSDYSRPALRLSALSEYPSIWIFTHDSIGLGEDGPTHQPVEHLAALRAIPNMVVIRPSDANETVEAWKVTIQRRNGPTALVLSRQNLPIIDRNIYAPANLLVKGAYVLADLGGREPEVILVSSGSEVNLIEQAGKRLVEEGKSVRLVSFPSWELFLMQDQTYQDSVFPKHMHARIAVEAGVRQGWDRWIGDKGVFIGMKSFGKSAPYEELYHEFGITVDVILRAAHEME